MLVTRWTRRVKRRILHLVARGGYDVEKVSGFPPYRLLKRIPIGSDPLADVARIHPDTVRVVFDVGAHVGQ